MTIRRRSSIQCKINLIIRWESSTLSSQHFWVKISFGLVLMMILV
jgi:hypothetical protein